MAFSLVPASFVGMESSTENLNTENIGGKTQGEREKCPSRRSEGFMKILLQKARLLPGTHRARQSPQLPQSPRKSERALEGLTFVFNLALENSA